MFAALFGLAGCANAAPEPPRAEPPVPTDSPSVSPSEDLEDPEAEAPTPEPLPLPDYPEDLTAEDTAENAILAAEYFLKLMNYAQSTGDSDLFEDASLPTCETCARMVEIQNERYGNGAYLAGNVITMSEPRSNRTEDGWGWVVIGDAAATDGVEVRNGKVTRTISGRIEKNFRIGVQLVDKEWRILEFARGKDV